jgi:REP element-mobilizing transposase RayT
MTRPRTELIALEATPWYHVVSRCVRRAFLCGQDHASGQNYEHRRGWIEARLRQLAGVFAIDIAAYAVMSNHYHIVLKVDQPRAVDWSDDEVLERWTRLFSGPLLVQRYLNADTRAQMGEAELDAVARWAETYRQRLADLSWFMRVLNEAIARQANAEDGVTGRFWEGRFKSQALLDEQKTKGHPLT